MDCDICGDRVPFPVADLDVEWADGRRRHVVLCTSECVEAFFSTFRSAHVIQ